MDEQEQKLLAETFKQHGHARISNEFIVALGMLAAHWHKKYQKSLLLFPVFYLLGFLTAYFFII